MFHQNDQSIPSPYWVPAAVVALAVIFMIATGCGGKAYDPLDDESREEYAELGQLEQGMNKARGYGIDQAAGNYQCKAAFTGTCLYPGFSYMTVSLHTGGMTTAESVRANAAVSAVISTLNTAQLGQAGQDPFEFSRVPDNFPADVMIPKASSGASGSAAIGHYRTIACGSAQTLSEPTPLNGVHRRCLNWVGTLDTADIAATYGATGPNGQQVAVHAVGQILLGTVGVGARDTGSTSTWPYSLVAPLGKNSLSSADRCKADNSALQLDDPGGINQITANTNCTEQP